jgi:uncharacterized membrane protein YqaE (UPF0057 family)
MKKIFSLSAIVIGVMMLLSSCSQLSNLSLTKRHYRSGYFVDFGGGKKADSRLITRNKTKNETQQVIATPAVTNNQAIVSNETPASPTKVIVATTTRKKETKQKHKQTVTPVVTSLTEDNTNLPNQNESVIDGSSSDESITATEKGGTNNGYDMTLIIICTILIPPLGVGLKFGIDSHFWIDLVLTLIFYFPGLIYGLIVVLQ